MTLPVVAAALLFWACVFMVCFTAAGTTPLEFFFGRYEPPPPNVGSWSAPGLDPSTQLLREERCLLPHRSSAHLLLQVRYRDPITRKIVRIDPEKRIARRRISSRS